MSVMKELNHKPYILSLDDLKSLYNDKLYFFGHHKIDGIGNESYSIRLKNYQLLSQVYSDLRFLRLLITLHLNLEMCSNFWKKDAEDLAIVLKKSYTLQYSFSGHRLADICHWSGHYLSFLSSSKIKKFTKSWVEFDRMRTDYCKRNTLSWCSLKRVKVDSIGVEAQKLWRGL